MFSLFFFDAFLAFLILMVENCDAKAERRSQKSVRQSCETYVTSQHVQVKMF